MDPPAAALWESLLPRGRIVATTVSFSQSTYGQLPLEHDR
jgi:hypothetical protein